MRGGLNLFAFLWMGTLATAQPAPLWFDHTEVLLPATAEWSNRLELADLDGDGRVDLLFANGGDYSTPGTPELNRVFLNRGSDRVFEEATQQILGDRPDHARVIKVVDVSGEGLVDIVVGTTWESQSRLYLGRGGGRFEEVTESHLPQRLLSVGDLEAGDIDGDGDLDLVLVDWGPGDSMTNAGGPLVLWINEGSGRFVDRSADLPDLQIEFSWDLELVDTDNDWDLDILVSCKRCGGGLLLRNDGRGSFTHDPRGLPQYTNNYDFEAMDLDGDGILDLVTINDGDIVGEAFSRREHIFLGGPGGRYRDATWEHWPPDSNIGEDDNHVAFLDFDSDGDADFLVASLTGPERLLINDGAGHFSLRSGVFEGVETPGTLGLELADLDGDHRLDAVQSQGEHETAVAERIHLGRGLMPDSAAPHITRVVALKGAAGVVVLARVHDSLSPSRAHDWQEVVVANSDATQVDMSWVGEYLWRAVLPLDSFEEVRVCASDAAGNSACSESIVMVDDPR